MILSKRQLLKRILAALTQSLSVLEKAARASHEEATHESSRAESKYDTRGLEAAYLAGGQARQTKEILDAIANMTVLELSELIKEMETKFGVSAAASVAAAVHSRQL